MKINFLYAFFISLFLSFTSGTIAQELCEECLDNVPQDIKDYVYNMDYMDEVQPLGPSIMQDWKSPSKPPWTIGYTSTYAGNT